jgi:hypothetical protein
MFYHALLLAQPLLAADEMREVLAVFASSNTSFVAGQDWDSPKSGETGLGPLQQFVDDTGFYRKQVSAAL